VEPKRTPIPRGVTFADALRGLKAGVRGQSSFFVHFFVAAAVLLAAWSLDVDAMSWCALVGCVGLVLTAELFKCAVEVLIREMDEATRERTRPALDIAAGGVLLAMLTAGVVGAILFVPPVWKMIAS
jgi:diacylglycerol kinase